MSWSRDLFWQNIEADYQSSVAHKLARYALGLRYEMLPQDVVHQAKRCLLDALACAIGAYDSPGRPICEGMVKDLGGNPEATVFGSGLRTNAANATLVNSFLVRFLDYNDMGGGDHNTDAIPAIMAICEREKASSREMLTSLVISYEIGSRVRDSYAGSRGEQVWNKDLRVALNMPPALGKLMGLTEEQIANAIGTCASGSLNLGILDPHHEEHVMRKNLRFGWVAYDAILSCLLAKRGFTGPVRVVEGDCGWREVILPDMNLEAMTDFSGWRILKTRHKYLCLCSPLHGAIYGTLAIVKEHDLKPEDIASVHVTSRRPANPIMKYPRNAESANHSPYYGTAFAIKERNFGPDSMRAEKFTDPVVLELIEKITVEADPKMVRGEGKSEIITRDGRRFEKHIVTPHGFGDDPLTDRDLEEKLTETAQKYMTEKQIREIIETVWNVDKLDDISKLTALMIVH